MTNKDLVEVLYTLPQDSAIVVLVDGKEVHIDKLFADLYKEVITITLKPA